MTKNQQIDPNLKPFELFQKISRFGIQYQNIPFQNFRGIINKTPDGKNKILLCHFIFLANFSLFRCHFIPPKPKYSK